METPRIFPPRTSLLLLTLCLAAGCASPPAEAPERAAPPTASPAPGQPAGPVAPPAAEAPAEGTMRIVFLGDSLTAGFGLAEEQAFPALVEESLRAEGRAVEVINAGVSGDTTAGGLSRLDWLLRQKPDVLVVGLGGNDGLRALPLEETEENLRKILLKAREAGARVLLLGMQIPPNYGPEYAEGFAALYQSLAEELDVPRVPFLLEGVGGLRELNLPDGIHPNPEGQKIVAETVLRSLRPVLEESANRSAPGS